MQKQIGGLTGNVYGTPYVDRKVLRISALDLVSALDNSAKTSIHMDPWNYLHDYHLQVDQNLTASADNAFGWKNKDGSISLRE